MNITEICMDIHNFFPPMNQRHDKSYIHRGHFIISGGSIAPSDFIKPNQYFRITGSIFNDGVHQNTPEMLGKLADEEFDGAIWLMAVPPDFLDLCKQIEDWRAKNEAADSVNMSPFTSESFGGYSYSKNSGGSSAESGNSVTWRSQFASRLNVYRKIRTF